MWKQCSSLCAGAACRNPLFFQISSLSHPSHEHSDYSYVRPEVAPAVDWPFARVLFPLLRLECFLRAHQRGSRPVHLHLRLVLLTSGVSTGPVCVVSVSLVVCEMQSVSLALPADSSSWRSLADPCTPCLWVSSLPAALHAAQLLIHVDGVSFHCAGCRVFLHGSALFRNTVLLLWEGSSLSGLALRRARHVWITRLSGANYSPPWRQAPWVCWCPVTREALGLVGGLAAFALSGQQGLLPASPGAFFPSLGPPPSGLCCSVLCCIFEAPLQPSRALCPYSSSFCPANPSCLVLPRPPAPTFPLRVSPRLCCGLDTLSRP